MTLTPIQASKTPKYKPTNHRTVLAGLFQTTMFALTHVLLPCAEEDDFVSLYGVVERQADHAAVTNQQLHKAFSISALQLVELLHDRQRLER